MRGGIAHRREKIGVRKYGVLIGTHYVGQLSTDEIMQIHKESLLARIHDIKAKREKLVEEKRQLLEVQWKFKTKLDSCDKVLSKRSGSI